MKATKPTPEMELHIIENPAEARYSTEIEWHLKAGQYFNIGVLEFNVVEAKRIAQQVPHLIVNLVTQEYFPIADMITSSPEAEVNLGIPCIVGMVAQPDARSHKYFTIALDGNCRIRQAHAEAKQTFRAIILSIEETAKCRR